VHGTFTGLVIADRVEHVNSGTQINGAVVGLSFIEVGNAFDNGNSSITYSRETLLKAVNNLGVTSGRVKLNIISYYE
jgi:hypothetical protein